MVDACGGSKEAFQLLMLEHIDTLAKTSAQAISNIKFDKVVVWDTGSSGAPEGAADKSGGGTATSNFLRGLATALPPTMHLMKDIAGIHVVYSLHWFFEGVDMPKYFGTLLKEEGILESKEEKIKKLLAAEEEAKRNQSFERADEYREVRQQLENELKTDKQVSQSSH
jgi:hypothetical protein